MAFMRIVRPPQVTAREYDAVNAEIDVEGNPPPGLLLQLEELFQLAPLPT